MRIIGINSNHSLAFCTPSSYEHYNHNHNLTFINIWVFPNTRNILFKRILILFGKLNIGNRRHLEKLFSLKVVIRMRTLTSVNNDLLKVD